MNVAAKDGQTVCLVAAQFCRFDALNKIVEVCHDVDLDIADEDGRTILHHMVSRGHMNDIVLSLDKCEEADPEGDDKIQTKILISTIMKTKTTIFMKIRGKMRMGILLGNMIKMRMRIPARMWTMEHMKTMNRPSNTFQVITNQTMVQIIVTRSWIFL